MAITIGSQTSSFPASVKSSWEVEDDITAVDENVPNIERAEIQAIETLLGVQSTKTGAYTTVATDGLILCDATSAAFTVTLLAVATALANKRYTIIKVDSSANAVTIDGNGAEAIDGAATVALTTQYSALQIYTDGAAWYSAGANLETAQTFKTKTLASPVITTAATFNAQAELRLSDSDSSNYVGLKSPATVSANKIWTMPSADGTANQFLKTDGAAALSFGNTTGQAVHGTFTRDMSLASGTQAVGGVGYTPKVVFILVGYAINNRASFGFGNTSTTGSGIFQDNTGVWSGASTIVYIDTTAGNNYQGVISTLDVDGFTISWTKTGSPTGTISCRYLCLG